MSVTALGILPGPSSQERLWTCKLACFLREFLIVRIAHSLTWRVLVVSMSVFIGACAHPQDSSLARESASRTSAVAIISNMLPVDGCSYPVTIDHVDYAPDPESLAAIRDRVPGGGELRVLIEYRLTGRTGQVECGFGASRTLPEIAFRVRRVLGPGGPGDSARPTT